MFERDGDGAEGHGVGPSNDGSRLRSSVGRRFILAGSVAAVVVVVDQLTKSWAVHRLSQGDIHVVWKLDLELTFNSGASFGLARGWAPIIGGIAVTAVVLLLAAVRQVRSDALAVALGLVIGGALGNLSDRIFRGHHGAVVDFIALHFWPTFNVADSCIVVGAVIAALLVTRRDPPVVPATPGHSREALRETGDQSAGPGPSGGTGT